MESNIINKVFKFKEGAVALISGASSGIGESIATLFSQVGNMNIVITGRRTDRLNMLADKLSINGCKVLPITCDVKDDNAVVKTVSRAVEEFGTIDILINSAGITEKSEDIVSQSREQWENVIETNLSGTYAMCREVASVMKEQKYGRIINISSGCALLALANQVAYVASKSGVIGLTRAMAVELGKYNITVNAIAPGYTLSEMTNPNSSGYKYFTSRSVLGRIATVDDLYGTVLLLASDASKFITGSVIVVDGGVTANT